MSKAMVVQARIEPQIKRKAEDVLRQLGLSPTEAIRLFYRQVCLRSGLPFRVEIPNAETRAVLKKSRKGEAIETFDSLEEMFASWKS